MLERVLQDSPTGPAGERAGGAAGGEGDGRAVTTPGAGAHSTVRSKPLRYQLMLCVESEPVRRQTAATVIDQTRFDELSSTLRGLEEKARRQLIGMFEKACHKMHGGPGRAACRASAMRRAKAIAEDPSTVIRFQPWLCTALLCK